MNERAPERREDPSTRRSESVETAYQPPSEDGYVGSAKCAECHGEIAELYETHPMSRSTRRVDLEREAALLRSAPSRVPGQQWVYDVEIRDGDLLHCERMFDADGELIYEQAVPMDYVVGSGQRAFAYLHQRGELLFMSPLNWYAQSRQWDLSPGYAPDDPRRFDRRITDDCLACHAGRLAAQGRALDRYKTPPFHEMSIGCENCHGPGTEHVSLHKSASGRAEAADPIVNPACLEPTRRESVCYQCHLQAPVRIPRYGRSDLDFRPGQHVEEIWSFLLEESSVSEDGRTRAVSHVQQMHASRCFIESQGRLGCISCHDPHRVPSESERVAFYRRRCLECHEGPDEAHCSASAESRSARDNDCTACHMPRRDANNISHVTQTDHRVLKEPEAASVDSDSGSDGLTLFRYGDVDLEPWERDRALALGAWMYLSKKGRPRPPQLAQILTGVLKKAPGDGASLTVLAAMAMDNQQLERARGYYERALEAPDAKEAALLGLLKISYLSSEWERGLEYADRFLEIHPGHAQAHAMRADILRALGRTQEGIEAAQQALRFNPTLIPVRQWLVETYRATGRDQERGEQEQVIRRMRSARPPAD